MSRGELPPTPLKHKKLWAAVVGVFASLCAASHKPMGNHRAHTTPIPYFTRGQENSQRSRAGTEMMEELENGTHCWLHLTDCCQMPAADGFLELSASWEPLLAAIHGHKSCVRTKPQKNHKWELRNVFYIRLSTAALQCRVLVWEERQTRDKHTHAQIFIVTNCCAEGWGKPPPLLY